MSLIKGKSERSYYQAILDCAASGHGVARMMLSDGEKIAATRMVKDGLLDKGTTDDKQRSVNFTITMKGQLVREGIGI